MGGSQEHASTLRYPATVASTQCDHVNALARCTPRNAATRRHASSSSRRTSPSRNAVSSNGSTNNAMSPGDIALLVDPFDETALRDGLVRLLEDDAWRRVAALRGVQRASAFTWSHCVDATVAGYRKVLACS